MKMILVGAGQVGGIIGGRLMRAGHDLLLCDADGAHVEAIRRQGLRVDLPGDSFTVRPKILFPSEITGQYDVLFIAVRSESTGAVLDAMAGHMTADATVVSLQNGMNLPLVVERVGAARGIGAVVRMRSIKAGPAHVLTHQQGYLTIGHIDGSDSARLEELHRLLNSAIPTKIAANMYGVMWSKLTFTSMRMLVNVSLLHMTPYMWSKLTFTSMRMLVNVSLLHMTPYMFAAILVGIAELSSLCSSSRRALSLPSICPMVRYPC